MWLFLNVGYCGYHIASTFSARDYLCYSALLLKTVLSVCLSVTYVIYA